MKLTKSQLRKIIKEELSAALREADDEDPPRPKRRGRKGQPWVNFEKLKILSMNQDEYDRYITGQPPRPIEPPTTGKMVKTNFKKGPVGYGGKRMKELPVGPYWAIGHGKYFIVEFSDGNTPQDAVETMVLHQLKDPNVSDDFKKGIIQTAEDPRFGWGLIWDMSVHPPQIYMKDKTTKLYGPKHSENREVSVSDDFLRSNEFLDLANKYDP